MNVDAQSGHIWAWTDKSDQTPGQIAGHVVPKPWIDKGYVKEIVDEGQTDIFDFLGG